MLEIQQSILKQNEELETQITDDEFTGMEVILLEGFNTRNKKQATRCTTTELTVRTFSGIVHI